VVCFSDIAERLQRQLEEKLMDEILSCPDAARHMLLAPRASDDPPEWLARELRKSGPVFVHSPDPYWRIAKGLSVMDCVP